MNQPTNHNSGIRKYLVWLFWIAVWQAANLLIHNNIIFVGPLDMIKALAEQAADPSFWTTILNSFARISLGFLGAFFLSILLGSLAYLFPLVKELLDPVMLLIKSVPCCLFRHPGTDMDRIPQPGSVHLLSGGSTHGLCKHTVRAGAHG